jgi:hypothetical protein
MASKMWPFHAAFRARIHDLHNRDSAMSAGESPQSDSPPKRVASARMMWSNSMHEGATTQRCQRVEMLAHTPDFPAMRRSAHCSRSPAPGTIPSGHFVFAGPAHSGLRFGLLIDVLRFGSVSSGGRVGHDQNSELRRRSTPCCFAAASLVDGRLGRTERGRIVALGRCFVSKATRPNWCQNRSIGKSLSILTHSV